MERLKCEGNMKESKYIGARHRHSGFTALPLYHSVFLALTPFLNPSSGTSCETILGAIQPLSRCCRSGDWNRSAFNHDVVVILSWFLVVVWSKHRASSTCMFTI